MQGIVMSRLPPLTLDEMTPEQRRVHGEFMAAHNGRVAITHLTWLRSLALASHIAKFGPYVRHQCLDYRKREMAMLIGAFQFQLPEGVQPAFAD
jgi:hypothetical protein